MNTLIEFREKKIPQDIRRDLLAWIEGKATGFCPETRNYYKKLYEGFYAQLVGKLDFSRRTDDKKSPQPQYANLIDQRARSLTRHFIKRKLGIIKSPGMAFDDINDSLLFDPHFHLNSIYVQNNPEFLHLLPDYAGIYNLLTGVPKDSSIEQSMRKDNVVYDVQYFNNPLQTHQEEGSEEMLYATTGYHRGGNLISDALVHGHCHSVDYCGHEYRTSEDDLRKYLDLVCKQNAHVIRFHMGETLLPEDGKEAVALLMKLINEKAEALQGRILRIGHGTHMSMDNMLECARKNIYVECCLSSNKETAVIGKRHEYPLGLMLLLGVPVVIGTDGGAMYHTTLQKEYAYAKKVLAKFINKIKQKSTEYVSLANGDVLTYQHIQALDTEAAINKNLNDPISYADLAKLQVPLKRLNTNQLIINMNKMASSITKDQRFNTAVDSIAVVDEVIELEDTVTPSTSQQSSLVQDQDLLQNLKLAVSSATKNYMNWYNGSDLRGANGYFTFLRHGQSGQIAAQKFNNEIQQLNNETDLITCINKKLCSSSTTYARHSYASFLLDELIKLPQWNNITKDKSNLYDKDSIICQLTDSVSTNCCGF